MWSLFRCEERISLPARSRIRLRAEASWPGWGRRPTTRVVKGAVGPEDGLDGESGRDVGHLGELGGPPSRQHADGRHALGAVDEGEPLFGLEHERLEAAATEGRDGRQAFAFEAHLALADHRQGEMGERGQVARGAERALLGHDRQQARARASRRKRSTTSRLTPEWPSASTWARKRQHRPDLLGGELVADGDRVRAKQPVLQGRGVLRGEVHVRQAAETGRHPVDDLPRLESRDDDLARAVDSLQNLLAQARRGAPGDRDDVFDAQRAAESRPVRRHEPSIAALRSRGPESALSTTRPS